jgi:F0F1-type ATP synthase delta subunit
MNILQTEWLQACLCKPAHSREDKAKLIIETFHTRPKGDRFPNRVSVPSRGQGAVRQINA